MQRAVSWNMPKEVFFLNFLLTNDVSDGERNPAFVIMVKSGINQQVTNVFYAGTEVSSSLLFQSWGVFGHPLQIHKLHTQVGTPEAVCPPTDYGNKKCTAKQKHQKWSQWLAGLIDGDGSFLVNKKGYSSLEITTHAKDETILYKIKQTYGGSIKARAGINAVRYRLHHKSGMIKLVNDVNGLVRHPSRLVQLKAVCHILEITPQSPDLLHPKHGWFAGMFDSDGAIRMNPNFQITISVTSKHRHIVENFLEKFGGSLYCDRSQNGYWTWAVQSQVNNMRMLEYFKYFPVRSSRRQRLFLVPKIYKLLAIKAHQLSTESILHKKWLSVLEDWKSYS